MIQTIKPLYEVVNMRIAGYLMMCGFPLIELNHKEQSNTFLFVDSPQLHEAIDRQSKRQAEYKQRKQNEHNKNY